MGVNLSVKCRIVYINYSLFMFIEAMCKGETKSRSRRCAKGSAPSARSSSLLACLVVSLVMNQALRNRGTVRS